MVRASCIVARSASPSRAAAYVITSREARSISVRMISGTPARPACLIPGRSGRSGADSRRAARTTTHTSATAEPTWASRVPSADPAMPRPDAVDQRDVEHDVGEVADDGDHQRGAGVLQAAEHAGRREHQQQGHRAEQRDPQVGHRELGDPVAGPEQVHDRPASAGG